MREALASGDPARIVRWLGREVGPDGDPTRLPIAAGWEALGLLGKSVRGASPDELESVREGVEPLVTWLAGMSRADGSTVLEAPARRPDRLRLLAAWARAGHGRPGGASIASGTTVRACLRPAQAEDGFLAVEAASGGFRVEGRGVSWLAGPSDFAPEQGSRPTAHQAGEGAEVYEWAATTGGRRVVGLMAMLGEGGAALLGGVSTGPLRWPLAEGVAGRGVPGGAARLERAGRSARVYRLGADSSRPEGGLAIDDGHLVVGVDEPPGRTFRAVLICWEPPLPRGPATLRPLTVTEGGRACRPGRAFAARVGWGRGRDGLVVYRSLGVPARRALLGHPTTTRFLIGRLTPAGDVRPLVALD